MASFKKRRKADSLERKLRQANAGLPPKRSKDGDRRRRTKVDLAREALKAKERTRDWTIDAQPPESSER